METNSRDRSKETPIEPPSKTKEPVARELPKDRRIPLKVVVFTGPVMIPGFEIGMTTCETGVPRLDGGANKMLPQPFLDPVQRTIWIEGREYPLERVQYWEKASFASTKKDPPPLPDYTIGKR